LKITAIETHVVKLPFHDRFGGQSNAPATFPGSDYYFENEWSEVYSRRVESLWIRISTDDGPVGWGESQAPIIPEVAQTIVDRLLGPMLLGRDPLETDSLYDLMLNSMTVRGHTTGFMLDAIAGLDIALWDIRGKASGKSVGQIFSTADEAPQARLPLYVSGLRADSPEGKGALAAQHFDEGYAGVKVFIGHGVEQDITTATAIRNGVGDRGRLFADALWSYEQDDALRLGKALEKLGFEWLEAPTTFEDRAAHAHITETLDMSVANGEGLRSVQQFVDWMDSKAMDIVQPDVGRCGITGSLRIATEARKRNLPVAYHVGVCLGIAMAATWQCAAATPHFLIQEHQPPPFERSNELFVEPLEIVGGEAVVPTGPGIGVDVDLQALEAEGGTRFIMGRR
jgi:galactonate dehydratase